MHQFTFLCIRDDGSIPTIDIQLCPNEAEALRRVPQLFREHDSCRVIEVWSGSRRLVEANRAA